jgi:hypothetical protein
MRNHLRNDAVVFVGDTIVPLIVDGGGWRTSITLTNLDTHQVHLQVLLLQPDGTDFSVGVAGLGTTRFVDVALPVHGSKTIDTTGATDTLRTGWAYLLQDSTSDVVGAQVGLRQKLSNGSELEATAPVVTEFDSHFVVLFDNQGGYDTAVLLTNPFHSAVMISAVIRDQDGNVLDQPQISVDPFTQLNLFPSQKWLSSVGRRGSIEFTVSGLGVGALGLRFSPAGTVSSYASLSNLNWLLN